MDKKSVQFGLKPHPEIKNIIAIASGKGGVGKSTTAVNIAAALASKGARVGILDADIYGPNQPQMLGVLEEPEVQDGQRLNPLVRHGMQTMSMGYLVDKNTPMVWRGPMVTKALQQLYNNTNWEDLDYLIVDMPPGTGDIQLTLATRIPVSGAVIVTTPQDLSLLDARKGLEMFKKVNVAVLGVVENMSTYICSNCGHEEAVFGQQGAARISEECDVPLLGQLPLDIKIREQSDKGVPIVIADPDHPISKKYFSITEKLMTQLDLQPKVNKAKFPDIVVE